jgi:phytoene dehydrogenase-like protein
MLEEKFAILDDYDENSLPTACSRPRDEAFIRKATEVLKREWDVFQTTTTMSTWTRSAGHAERRAAPPHRVAWRDLLERGESNLRDLLAQPTMPA